MIGYEREEAATVAQDLLGVMLGLSVADKGRPAADYRRKVAATHANVLPLMTSGAFVDEVAACFDFAATAGASYLALGLVREAAQVASTASVVGTATRHLFLRLAAVYEAMAATSVDLRSREAADAMLTRFRLAFDPAIEAAADGDDAEVYRALRALYGSVTRRLIDAARPLPQITAYRLARGLPSLVLAQRLYGDPSRHIELIDENKVLNPAFAPAAGRAYTR